MLWFAAFCGVVVGFGFRVCALLEVVLAFTFWVYCVGLVGWYGWWKVCVCDFGVVGICFVDFCLVTVALVIPFAGWLLRLGLCCLIDCGCCCVWGAVGFGVVVITFGLYRIARCLQFASCCVLD